MKITQTEDGYVFDFEGEDIELDVDNDGLELYDRVFQPEVTIIF